MAQAEPPRPRLLLLQIAPTRLRGTLGSINQLLICTGILGALLVNVVLPASAWRLMFGLSAAPAVLLGLGARRGGRLQMRQGWRCQGGMPLACCRWVTRRRDASL